MHRSVLPDDAVRLLITEKDGIYVDATLGDGGHSKAILEKFKKIRIIAIDKDKDALKEASKNLSLFANRVQLIYGDFADLERLVREDAGEDFVNGVLLDLGLRSSLVEDSARGFSFKADGPLDMRFDRNSKKTAFDVVNRYTQCHLTDILKQFGDISEARQLARRIVLTRLQSAIETTSDLVQIVERLFPPRKTRNILPKIFQAIRIEVNDEFPKLISALKQAMEIISPGGRIAVIAYHSGEDRIVKDIFASETRNCICPPGLPVCRCGHKQTLKVITTKPLIPTKEEIAQNPKSRSAKLRVAEKL